MPTAYTLPTTLFVLSFLFFFFIVFMYWPVIYAFFKGTPVDDWPKADRKPTKAEIEQRNEVNRLLHSDELDEYPTIVRNINLDQHEKAIS